MHIKGEHDLFKISKYIRRSLKQTLLKKKNNDFIIVKGSNDVIISCPHSVKQLRRGRSKSREKYTKLIGLITQYKTDCHLIYKNVYNHDDANYDKLSDYLVNLADYIKENNIKYLIDLHGCSSKRKFSVEIGTQYGHNILNDETIVDEVIGKLKENRIIKTSVDTMFDASPKTISYKISEKCNIKCIQLEINKNFRMPKKKPKKFICVCNAIIDIANHLVRRE